jgi:hypothetical protein
MCKGIGVNDGYYLDGIFDHKLVLRSLDSLSLSFMWLWSIGIIESRHDRYDVDREGC